MRLHKLTLKNFKGLRDFVFEPEGHDCKVFGENATGKTTLVDGFNWCLFGKDSLGQAQFEIKTIGSNPSPENGLEHEVEVVLDGMTLRKVLTEKWVKKRGSVERTFTGHDINHFIDGVPVKKGEFDARISQVCDEQTFRLLTNPRHFSDGLHWQKRREVLLQVCGEISDSDVVASNPGLEALPGILGKRSLDDHRKIILARRVEVNREIEQIPVRISEVQAGMLVPEEADEKRMRSKLEVLKSEFKARQEELVRLETGGEISELTSQIRLIEGKVLDLQNKTEKARQSASQKKYEEMLNLQARMAAESIETKNAERSANQRSINLYEKEILQLRDTFRTIAAKVFHGENICPACGQTLPEESMQSTVEAFNLAKANELEEINQRGRALKEKVEGFRIRDNDLGNQIRLANESLAAMRKEYESLQKEVERMRYEPEETPAEIVQANELIARLRARVAELQDGARAEIEDKKQQIAFIAEEIDTQNRLFAKLEQHAKAEKRIEELKKSERVLAKEYERIEYELHLCDLFLRMKVSMLTEKINSRFEFTRFKLFNELINGGIEPCCDVIVNGVTYPNLNNAARIQSGLDIIKTLQKHYGFNVPCWIDNAEAVTCFPDMENQMIWLYVSAPDKTLRIEKENNS